MKIFLWQLFQERLSTTSLRKMRGLSETGECPLECLTEETLIRIMRDCDVASNVWKGFINPMYHSLFFSGDLQDQVEFQQQPGDHKVNMMALEEDISGCVLVIMELYMLESIPILAAINIYYT